MIPDAQYNMSKIFCGREAVIATLGGWQIAMNGMLVASKLNHDYVKQNYDPKRNTIFADELDQRKLLLSASSVAIKDASYLYRQQQGSVIHKVNLRRFDQLIDIGYYLDFVFQNFTDDRDTINKVLKECLEKTYRCQQMFLANKKVFKKEERNYISKLIKTTYKRVTSNEITGLGLKYKLLSVSYPLFIATTYIINAILSLKK